MRSPFIGVGIAVSVGLAAIASTAIAAPAAPSLPADHHDAGPALAAQTPLAVLSGSREAIAEAKQSGIARFIAPFGGGAGSHAWVVRPAFDAAAISGHPGLTATPIDAYTLVDLAAHTHLEAGLSNEPGTQSTLLNSYWIIPTDRDRLSRRRVGAQILAAGGTAELIESDGLLMRADLTPRGLAALVLSGEILWAEPATAPETDGSFVRDFGGANAIETIEGFLGTGVIVEIVDKGLYQDHNDLLASDPYLRTLNDGPTDHGTATYGIMFGNGETESEARGMMPGQPGLFSSYLEIGDRDAHLAGFAADFGGVIQSNSWGSGVNRRYTAPSAEMDDSILRHGVLVFQSQSNRGNPDSRPEAWAKNAISVGGINGHGTLDRSDDTWAGGASTGPAIDGRIKPDLVLFNDGILTTSDEGTATHAPFTGTSAATPAVAGHAGIMVEMWRAGLFHGGDPLAVPADRPSVAMARAIMINFAEPYAFTHTADDLGRYRQGWGTPDLVNMWARAPRTAVFDGTQPLAEGEAWVRTFTVNPGEARAAFSLAWTDPAALPFADRTAINDLDLRAVSPSGAVYLGNAGLHDGNDSTPGSRGGNADRANTIENVFIAQPEPGTWQVEVVAHRVAIATVEEAGDPRTPFALLATGVDPQPGERAVRIVGDIPERFPARDELVIDFETHGFAPSGNGEIRLYWDNTLGGFPMTRIGPDRFQAIVSGLECGVEYQYRIAIDADDGTTVIFPPDADGARPVAIGANAVRTDANQSVNWTTDADDDIACGAWERGTPVGGGLRWDPPFDADGDDLCWLTDNRAGNSGISGGTVTLTSAPIPIDVTLEQPAVAYDLWLASDAASLPTEDTMLVEVSFNFGQTWSPLASERSSFRWQRRVHPIDPGDSELVMVRFSIGDGGDGSHVEAGIDGLALVGQNCPPCLGDIDGNGAIDLNDIGEFVFGYSNRSSTADLTGDGMIDLADVVRFIIDFQTRCR